MRHAFPDLRSLLGGETLTIEYKRDLDSRNKQGPMATGAIAEALMALGNQQGGYLLIGVEDDGGVTGVHRSRQGSPEVLAADVCRQFVSRPEIDATELTDGQHRVLVLRVEPAAQTPYQLNDGSLRIREDRGARGGPENVPFLLARLVEWQAMRGVHHDWSSALLRDLAWSDAADLLDPLALEVLDRRVAEGRAAPTLRSISHREQQMDALGLVTTVDGRRLMTYACLLLFGSSRALREFVPAHRAQFQVFDAGGTVTTNLATDTTGMEHPCLICLAERIDELLQGAVPRQEMMDGLFRLEVPAYGDDALRESILNAFVHRDYTVAQPVVIQLHRDHFLVTNPGGFYRDVTAENILFHEPCARNQCLAQACSQLGLMERSGRGVDRIYWDQIRYLRPLPSYAGSNPQTVRLMLSGGSGALEAIRAMIRYFGDRDLRDRVVLGSLVYALIERGDLGSSDLIGSVPALPPDEGRRGIGALVNAGVAERYGHGRGQLIRLSSSCRSELGLPAGMRPPASAAAQQRVVLDLLARTGSIRRADAASALGLPAGAGVYRLLDGMVQQGLLVRLGERRTARYELPRSGSDPG